MRTFQAVKNIMNREKRGEKYFLHAKIVLCEKIMKFIVNALNQKYIDLFEGRRFITA